MYYFAFGADVDFGEVALFGRANQLRLPRVRSQTVATLADFSLCFPRFEARRGGGVPDIQETPGASITGVLFDLAGADVAHAALDQFHDSRRDARGRDIGTRRRDLVTVQLADGTQVEAELYRLCKPEWMYVPPSRAFLEQLTLAAYRAGASMQWIMQLRSFRSEAWIGARCAGA